jgi:hypothetical protein
MCVNSSRSFLLSKLFCVSNQEVGKRRSGWEKDQSNLHAQTSFARFGSSENDL